MSNILYIGGDHDFLRDRFVRKVVQSELMKGRKLLALDGRDDSTLFDIGQAFSNVVLFDQKILIHVTYVDRLKDFSFLEHLSDDTIIILLESKKKIKPKKLVLDKKLIKGFNEPSFYKMEEKAVGFLIDELKSRGCTIPRPLAKSVVQGIGTDLGILAFEALKMSHLGPGEINVNTIKSTLAPLSEVGPDRVIHALESRNPQQLLRSMKIYRRHQRYDPTIALCGRYLSPLFFRWLQAASSPYLPKETAEKIGVNPWYWKNKVSPPAVKWGVEGVHGLIRAVSEAQSAVHKGYFSPWTLLETRLIQACVR